MFLVLSQDPKHPGGRKLLGCHYNDVSLSEKTVSQVDCIIDVSFVFVDIAVFVTGFTRLLVQPRAACRLLNYSQVIDIRTGSGPGTARRVEIGQIAYNVIK